MNDVLFNKHRNNPIFREAIISGLPDNEGKFLEDSEFMSSFSEPLLRRQLAEVIVNKETETVNPIFYKN